MYINAKGTGQSKEKAFYWIDIKLSPKITRSFTESIRSYSKKEFSIRQTGKKHMSIMKEPLSTGMRRALIL